MSSEDGETKRTPRSQTEVLEGDSDPGQMVHSVVWEREFLSVGSGSGLHRWAYSADPKPPRRGA